MQKAVTAILVVLFLVSAGAAYTYYNKYQGEHAQVMKLMKDPNAVAKKEADDTTMMVGKLMSLPNDEKPTIATIADKSKIDIKQQPFFTNAENGDKVLLYVKAKKAILFRPSANKIIEVGILNVQQNSTTPTPSPAKK